MFLTGHSHQQYVCSRPDPDGRPRPVVQGLSFGRLLSVVDLTVENGDVVRDRTTARNEVVTRDVAPDPAVAALVSEAVQKAAPVADRPVGSITQDLVRAAGPSGESPLGDVIADAQLAATRSAGAQVALTNPGGIRADLTFAPDGVVSYGEAFTVQPFGNIMQTVTLTGAQLRAVLEQQWQPSATRFLQISSTLHYAWSQAAPTGAKVSDVRIDGVPVDPAATYRVSVNNFLAAGGDGFTGFTAGTDVTGGVVDLDALLAHLAANPGLAPPAADRVTVLP